MTSPERIRIVPDPTPEYENWAFVSADVSEAEAIKSAQFLDSLQGVLDTERELEVTGVPGMFAVGSHVSEDYSEIKKIADQDFDGEVKTFWGNVGIRIETGEDRTIKPELAKHIGALIAREYSDEQERHLVNYTNGDTAPIRLTGEGYNLAAEITDEHEAINLEEAIAEEYEESFGFIEHSKIALSSLMERFMPRHAH